MKYLKIKDSAFIRDVKSSAILNTNEAELMEFNDKRRRILEQKKQSEETRNKIIKLEEDVNEIKNLLKELIQSRSTNGN